MSEAATAAANVAASEDDALSTAPEESQAPEPDKEGATVEAAEEPVEPEAEDENEAEAETDQTDPEPDETPASPAASSTPGHQPKTDVEIDKKSSLFDL